MALIKNLMLKLSDGPDRRISSYILCTHMLHTYKIECIISWQTSSVGIHEKRDKTQKFASRIIVSSTGAEQRLPGHHRVHENRSAGLPLLSCLP